jgi:IS5 family transposase
MTPLSRLDQRPGPADDRRYQTRDVRCAAVEPGIHHLKADHRIDRNYLKSQDGDRINIIPAATGLNFHLFLTRLAAFLRATLVAAPQPATA